MHGVTISKPLTVNSRTRIRNVWDFEIPLILHWICLCFLHFDLSQPEINIIRKLKKSPVTQLENLLLLVQGQGKEFLTLRKSIKIVPQLFRFSILFASISRQPCCSAWGNGCLYWNMHERKFQGKILPLWSMEPQLQWVEQIVLLVLFGFLCFTWTKTWN